MPRETWDALVRGENCPLCAVIDSDEPADSHGYTIADLSFSRLRLATNQYCPGYCVLICHRHVREPYELGRQERATYFEDLMRAAQAIETVFQPIKMNFEILGNAVPHLHCHIIPRYYGDPAPGAPLQPDAELVELTPDEYEQRVEAIREALEGM
jgi:diadenosine tetraphosphate (Ap4A) HIT family hydrolase